MDNNKKILLDVPYYSQWLDVKDPDWQYRSCGVAALKMAMLALPSFSEEGDMGLDDLIKEGLASGAYKLNVGWIHEGLVNMAKKYEFSGSFRKEWAADKSADGINFIIDIISQNIPVIASVKSSTGGHLVLLSGFENVGEKLLGFFMNDPDAKEISLGKNRFINIHDFMDLWKKRIIVIKKSPSFADGR
ncbi:MAG: C39 family peptidase [bacterium]|nr:C39 family peptidase [bacterium]